MPDKKDTGAIPQGLIEQARAPSVDPGKLQMLGKQAAALYTENRTPLNDAVLSVIGDEDLGPEHTRRVCEFANQAAFQNEWEKGGSVRNIEFDGGPADPSVILREMHDGSRSPQVHVSDYDSPPTKMARADRRVEEEIFGKYAQRMVHPSEIPSGMPDIHRLRQTAVGAQDHIRAQLSKAEIAKEAVEREMADTACDLILGGESLYKVAAAWSIFCGDKDVLNDALQTVTNRMEERKIPLQDIDMEKEASATGKIPNPSHPVVSRFIEFSKVATQCKILNGASNVMGEQIPSIDRALRSKTAGRRPSIPASPAAMLAGVRGGNR